MKGYVRIKKRVGSAEKGKFSEVRNKNYKPLIQLQTRVWRVRYRQTHRQMKAGRCTDRNVSPRKRHVNTHTLQEK